MNNPREAIIDSAGCRWISTDIGRLAILVRFLIIVGIFFLGDVSIFHLLKNGMDRYYGLNKPARVLCVGHSHTVLGIDAQRLESELGVPVAKYATSGANTMDRLWMVRQYMNRQPSVKTVIYDVDPRLFDSEGLSSASYTLFLPYIDDPAMAPYLRRECSWQEYAVAKVLRTARFRDQSLLIALRGLLGKIEAKKATSLHVENVKGFLERERKRKVRINTDSVACFRETIDFLTGKGIQVVLAFIPVADLLNATDPVGMVKATEIFREVADRNPNVYFFDYNRDYQHQHELFYDLQHLNGDGNRIVTGRLIEDIRRSKDWALYQ